MHSQIKTTTYRGHEIALAEYRANGADQSGTYYTQTNDVDGTMLGENEDDEAALKVYANPDRAIDHAKQMIEEILDIADRSEVIDTACDALACASPRNRRNLRDALRSFTGQANDPQHSPTDATMAALGRALAEAIDHAISNDSQWSNR